PDTKNTVPRGSGSTVPGSSPSRSTKRKVTAFRYFWSTSMLGSSPIAGQRTRTAVPIIGRHRVSHVYHPRNKSVTFLPQDLARSDGLPDAFPTQGRKGAHRPLRSGSGAPAPEL